MNVILNKLKFLHGLPGIFLTAFGVSVFLVPNNIVGGGFSGIATVLKQLLGTPVGVMVLALNIPVFLISFRTIDWKFSLNSLFGMTALSVFLDLIPAVIPTYQGDKFLCAIFGGILSGAGLGLVFLASTSTGGVDLIAKLINHKYPHLPIGRLILILDGTVILMSTLVSGEIESALYATVAIYSQSAVIDKIVYGADSGKVFLINSQKSLEIASQINSVIKRGATLLCAQGAYTNTQTTVILCAVRRHEASDVMKIIKTTDKNAFTLTLDAGEIFGLGFRENS